MNEIEQRLERELEWFSKEINKVLIQELSQSRADWVMNDINHLIFSHLRNDIVSIIETNHE